MTQFRFLNSKKDYTEKEIKAYFDIFPDVLFCKKNFKQCKSGKYYLYNRGQWYGCDYVVNDWVGFDFWQIENL